MVQSNEKIHFLQSNDLKTSFHSHFQETLGRKTLRGCFSPESCQEAERRCEGEIEEEQVSGDGVTKA